MPLIVTDGMAVALLVTENGTVPLANAGSIDPKPNARMVIVVPGIA